MAAISLVAAVGVGWSVHQLLVRISGSVAARCYNVAVLALLAHVVAGLVLYSLGAAVLSCAAGFIGIAVLVSLGIRQGTPFVSGEAGAILSPARSTTQRVTVLALITIAVILTGEVVSVALPTASARGQELAANLSVPRLFELAVVTPGFEELCFRGVLLAGLRSQMSCLRSAVVSSFLFSLFHPGDIGDVGSVFLRSFVWAIAVLLSGSLMPAVLAHSIHNIRGMLSVT
jgi:membrane protease YdiL (CAAX protease family)